MKKDWKLIAREFALIAFILVIIEILLKMRKGDTDPVQLIEAALRVLLSFSIAFGVYISVFNRKKISDRK